MGSDIVDIDQWLLMRARQFEDQHAPRNLTEGLRTAAGAIITLRADVERLRAALDAVLVGGNHLVSIIGPCHPPAGMAHDYVLSYYGPGHQYDAWCCWNAIMAARAALGEEKKV